MPGWSEIMDTVQQQKQEMQMAQRHDSKESGHPATQTQRRCHIWEKGIAAAERTIPIRIRTAHTTVEFRFTFCGRVFTVSDNTLKNFKKLFSFLVF